MLNFAVPDSIVALMVRCTNVAILVHKDPDADALGSALALQQALRSQSKTAEIFYSGSISTKLDLLFQVNGLIKEVTSSSLNLFETSDLIILCDTREPSRIGDWYEPLLNVMSNIETLSIDHHEGTYSFKYIWNESTFSSTAEMVTHLIKVLDWGISFDIAVCLAAGIVSDTGNFTYTNSTSSALETVAYLVELGANLNYISSILDSPGKLSTLRLWSEAVLKSREAFDGKYVWTTISHNMLNTYIAQERDLEGLGSYLRAIDGVQIAAVFYEQTAQQTRVSLRSITGIDVQSIARQYSGGGGHKEAAGCIISLNMQDAQLEIVNKVNIILRTE
jgi:phosphoesterase RecJ-like protein